jgi:hypothetical protein
MLLAIAFGLAVSIVALVFIASALVEDDDGPGRGSC